MIINMLKIFFYDIKDMRKESIFFYQKSPEYKKIEDFLYIKCFAFYCTLGFSPKIFIKNLKLIFLS